MINSIGQALAKAMTERMKETDPRIDITAEGSIKVAQDASFPANSAPKQPAPAKGALKKGTSHKVYPAKAGSVETAKAPIAATVESAATNNTDSAETEKTPSAPKRPDWVGKPPFLWRAGKAAEFPDYYQIVHTKPTTGDALVMCVSTDPFSTLQECEANIPEVLQAAVNQYMDRYLGRQWMGYVQLSPEQLSQLVVAEYEETRDFSFGKMTQIHLLLSFDQKAKELIDDAIVAQLFANRASVAGTGFIGLWLFLAVIWGYLKLDLATKGAHRTRLRVTATLATLTLAWMIIAVLRALA